jgi:hypothetical protein
MSFTKLYNNKLNSTIFNVNDWLPAVKLGSIVADSIQSATVQSNSLVSNQIQTVDASLGVVDMATQLYVGSAISDLVGNSSGLLDTLQEIGNALQGDASFGLHMAQRLSAHDASFVDVSSHFGVVDTHFGIVDASGAVVDTRLNNHDTHFGLVDASCNSFTTRLNGHDTHFVVVDASCNSFSTRLNNSDTHFGLVDTSLNSLAGKTSGISYDSGSNTTILNSKVSVSLNENLDGNVIIGNASSDTLVVNSATTFAGTVSGLTKATISMNNIDNTSDLNKPISTATQTALNTKGTLASSNTWSSTNNFTGAVQLSGVNLDTRISNIESLNTSQTSSINVLNSKCSAIVFDSSLNQTTLNSKLVVALSETNQGATIIGNDTADTLVINAQTTFANSNITGLTKTHVGLSNVDNTSDLNKGISTATQTALNLKSDITYVDTAVANLVNSAPSTLNTLQELANSLSNDSSFSTTMTTALAGKGGLASSNTWSNTNNFTGAVQLSGVNLDTRIGNIESVNTSQASSISTLNSKCSAITFDSSNNITTLNSKLSVGVDEFLSGNLSIGDNASTDICNLNASIVANGQTVSATRIGYLATLSGNVQTALNSKCADSLACHLSGSENLTGSKTFSGGVVLSSNITANGTTISPTELSYIDGATSNIQTQITTLNNRVLPTYSWDSSGKNLSVLNSAINISQADFDNADPVVALASSIVSVGELTQPVEEFNVYSDNVSFPTGSIAQSSVNGLVAGLAAKASLASPSLTGVPISTTASTGDNSTQIATTAFVKNQSYLTTSSASSTYAPLASATLTGTPVAPTASTGDSSTQLATTAFVKNQSYLTTSSASSTYAPLASASLTGTPLAPTASTGDSSTQIATTAFVKNQSYLTTSSASSTYAPLSAPALTGNPTTTTQSTADNSTRIASTAYVQSNLSNYGTLASSSTYSGNNTFSSYNHVNQFGELIHNAGSGSSLSLTYTSVKGVVYYTPSANFTLTLTSVPSPTSNLETYSLTLIYNAKYYANAISVNGSSYTMIAGAGLSNISINASATYVMQQINICYLNSSTPTVITNVLSLW